MFVVLPSILLTVLQSYTYKTRQWVSRLSFATNAFICESDFDTKPFPNHQRVARLRYRKETIRPQRCCAACVGVRGSGVLGGVHAFVI